MPAARQHRQQLVRELVGAYPVSSQADIVVLLGRHGVEATQATVSRDLEELAILKARGADGILTYVLPGAASLAQVLRQFALAVDASGNLAVVRTPPGGAGTVANAIDRADLPGVLATVQGDDTLIVVALEGTSGREIADTLLRLKDGRA